MVTPVPAFTKLLCVFPFSLLLLLLLSVPERFTVLIYRARGAAPHAQVILIKLPLFGRVFRRSLRTRVSVNLPAFQDVKRDLEKCAGEAVFLRGAEVRTCIPALEPADQQTPLRYDHAFIWFDLQRHTIIWLFYKMNRTAHNQHSGSPKQRIHVSFSGFLLINHSAQKHRRAQETTVRLSQGQRSVFNLCALLPPDLTLSRVIDH